MTVCHLINICMVSWLFGRDWQWNSSILWGECLG